MIQKRKKANSSKINLIISVTVHAILFVTVVYFAAREGILGKKLKLLAVTMVKEKPPEPPKPKAEEPKPVPPKTDQAPKPAAPPPVQTAAAPPPPAVNTAPAVAPPPVSIPSFDFNDGAKDVSSISDPTGIYKALIEHTVKGNWNRPEDMPDDNFVAEVEFSIDTKGRITGSRWLSGSGDSRWDNSVKSAVAQVKAIGKAPPRNFPDRFVVRFDVESTPVEGIQVSSR